MKKERANSSHRKSTHRTLAFLEDEENIMHHGVLDLKAHKVNSNNRQRKQTDPNVLNLELQIGNLKLN
jgi:hypothetical protein